MLIRVKKTSSFKSFGNPEDVNRVLSFNEEEENHVGEQKNNPINKDKYSIIGENKSGKCSFPIIEDIKCTAIKNTSKHHRKSMVKFHKYLLTEKNDIPLKSSGLIPRNEEIKLKCYLRDMPDFFVNDKQSKNIYFGMNKKHIFKNNALFTDCI